MSAGPLSELLVPMALWKLTGVVSGAPVRSKHLLAPMARQTPSTVPEVL